MDRIIELAEKYADEMIENRRKIHKNPELGGQETDRCTSYERRK